MIFVVSVNFPTLLAGLRESEKWNCVKFYSFFEMEGKGIEFLKRYRRIISTVSCNLICQEIKMFFCKTMSKIDIIQTNIC